MKRTSACITLMAFLLVGAAQPPQREVQESVNRALNFLKSAQQPDGAWEAGFGKATSTTSLGVMAFLASGHTPDQPGPYRETVLRGIRFVLDNQRVSGLIAAETSHGPMYCHGISSLMLAEVVGMIEDEALAKRCRDALAKAIDLILKAQAVVKSPRDQGGWRYRPDSIDSDLSVSGWQIMALRAARDAGCAVPSSSIDNAINFVKRCAIPPAEGGGFGYQPGTTSPNNPRAGIGILALELQGERLAPPTQAAVQFLANHPPQWSSEYFFYEVYCCPPALFLVGDQAFQPYHQKLVPILLEHQERDGSWLSGDNYDRQGGRNYCTAAAVLALSVQRQLLPIYQR